jgi:hypothetical protein
MESERLDLRDLDRRHQVVRNYDIRAAKAQKVETLTPFVGITLVRQANL